MLVTDGEAEARTRESRLNGDNSPRDILARRETDELTASEIVEIVIDDVGKFRNGAEQSDDMAVVVIKT